MLPSIYETSIGEWNNTIQSEQPRIEGSRTWLPFFPIVASLEECLCAKQHQQLQILCPYFPF